MFAHCSRLAVAAIFFGAYVVCTDCTPSQELVPPPGGQQAPAPEPGIPKGVEVQARGPIHEAFASPTTEPKQPLLLPKKPPLPIEEMPPEEKPEGDAVWIGGYFSWDDDRQDYMWVSGCWRVRPTNMEWVPGYFREVGDNWQWVSGFWSSVQAQKAQPGSQPQAAQPVTYYPEPPAPPNVAPPGDPPRGDMIFVPGYYMWNGDRYISHRLLDARPGGLCLCAVPLPLDALWLCLCCGLLGLGCFAPRRALCADCRGCGNCRAWLPLYTLLCSA